MLFGTYRTVLAVLVVALHLGGVKVIGSYAVFGFYILSGFLMTFILQKTYGYSLTGFKTFWLNRFLRLFPLYWVSITVTIGLIAIWGQRIPDYYEAMQLPGTLWEAIKNLFILFPDRQYPRLTPPAWALTVELFFYFLIACGLSKTPRRSLIWFALSAIYHVVAMYLERGWESRYFAFSAASLPFATGALLYWYSPVIKRNYQQVEPRLRALFPALVYMGLILNWYLGLQLGIAKTVSFYINYLICALMVAILSCTTEHIGVSKQLDNFLGRLSYPIYLIHYQVGFVVITAAGGVGVTLSRHQFSLFLAALPVVVALAWLMAKYIEDPIDHLRERVKRNKKPDRPDIVKLPQKP